MKQFFVYSILFCAMLVTTPRARAAVEEDASCLDKTKTIRLENQNLAIKGLQLLGGNKILMESRNPGQKIELNCNRDGDHQDKPTAWTEARVQKSLTAWGWLTTPAAMARATYRQPVTLHNTDETPLRTEIKLFDSQDLKATNIGRAYHGDGRLAGLSIKDLSDPGQSEVLVHCLGWGFSVSTRDKNGKVTEQLLAGYKRDRSLPQSVPVPGPATVVEPANIPVCQSTFYALNASSQSLKAVEGDSTASETTPRDPPIVVPVPPAPARPGTP